VYKSPHSEHQPKGQDCARLVSLCSKLLNPGGWLICMFHRFDATWDQSDAEIITASTYTLKMIDRFTSECDFPDENVDRKLRVTVFEKI
jgi:23S rRNA (cytosine1962-C5)-methyltransferase